MLENDLKLCHCIVPTLPQERESIRNNLMNLRGIRQPGESFSCKPSSQSEAALDTLLDQLKSNILLYSNENQIKESEELFKIFGQLKQELPEIQNID